jgi:hypothetical protein
MKSSISWNKMSYCPLKVNRRFGGSFCLHFQRRRISEVRNERRGGKQSVYRLFTLKMGATCSSKTTLDFQWTAQHFIPENRIFHEYFLVHPNRPLILSNIIA